MTKKLDQQLAEFRALLARSERISDWIDRFEHPELTRTLSQVAERVADMGI